MADYVSVITPNTDLTVADFDGRGPGTSTNLSTGDIRRKYNFGSRVSELAIPQDPFFRFLSKAAKKATDDPQFKFTEKRPSYHKRYGYVVDWKVSSFSAADCSSAAQQNANATVTAANINTAGANLYGQTYTEEGAPWDWWDNASYEAIAQAVNAGSGAPAGYFAADAITGNPNMSASKGNAYLDTIQGYLNPRMFAVLGFVAGCTDSLADNFDALANIDDGSCTYPTNSIYDIVSNSPDHTTLKAAIDACALNGVLSDPGSLTLFAPTDAAFDLLPAGTVTALLADIPQLTDILKHHVVGAGVPSSALSNGQVVTTLLGTDVTITINSMGVYIDNAMVTVVDIVADNGVVHVINAVLIPTTTDIIDYNNLEKVYLYSVNILGEKVSKNSKNQVIFNVFQDGSVERKLIIE